MNLVRKFLTNYKLSFANANKIIFFLADMLIVASGLPLSLIIRFIDEGPITQKYLERIDMFMPISIISAGIIFYLLQTYRHLWQFANINQYAGLLIGTTSQTVLLTTLMLIRNARLPWSVYLMYWLLSSFLMLGYRILYREIYRLKSHWKVRQTYQTDGNGQGIYAKSNHSGYIAQAKRVLIYGAGKAGYEVIRDLQENSRGKIPVVVLDDNKQIHHNRILGVKVLGGRDKFQEAVSGFAVDLIVIAIPSAPSEEIRKIYEAAQVTGCEIKVLPNLYDLYDSKPTFSMTRDIEITDLLGRSEIDVDLKSIGEYLKDQTVLVTGGGGSIGSELCRQVARFIPRKLIVFDIYENNAYQLANELKLIHGDKLDMIILIGSVRDPERLKDVFERYRPNVVFHAAAHKHVPLMEDSPGEAIKNNILGTYNVAMIAGQVQASRFVLISTDKAVNPTNVMGATKRIAEMTVQTVAKQFPATKYAAVRFGNVLGSNGSVVPLFQNQIKFQQKVTVTHPDITRYFMTIPEAVRLVIQAGALTEGGETFILDMGQPVKIVDLARELIRLNGFEPDVDIKIEYTGLRPGEKMFEELFLDKENFKKTKNDHIFILNPITDKQSLSDELHTLLQLINYSDFEQDLLIKKILSEG